jgi:hypothetical protein
VADEDVRVPAGWYPDPLGLPQLRWWDNHAWTEHVSDARQPMVAPPAVAPRVTFAEPEEEREPRRDPGPTLDSADGGDRTDDAVDERTVQLSRRARRARERLADEPDDALGAPVTAPAFGDPQRSLEAPDRDQVSVAEPSPAVRLGTSGPLDEAPAGAAYELGTRYEDLLGESPAPVPAFGHAGTSTAALVPDTEPEPAGTRLPAGTRQAEAGPRLGTAPVWIMSLLPLYLLVVGLLLLLSNGRTDQSIVAIAAMFGVTWAAGLLLAVLDGRLLRAQGVERPASWAWAALGVLVYLVARLMRTVRENGTGFGPLLAFLALGAFLLGGVLAVPGLVMQVAPTAFSHQAETSVAADAAAIGARVRVECPDVPPLLVQQTMTCRSTKLDGDRQQFDVTVSLQRVNGWIDWRVDDWGIFTAS